MSSLYPLEPAKQDHAVHGAWSHRRSAAFVLGGGVAFWAIVILIFLLAR